MAISYSVDDGETWLKCDGILVAVHGQELPGEEQPGELIFNFTHEGLITDVWANDLALGSPNLCVGTDGRMYDDIVELLCRDADD